MKAVALLLLCGILLCTAATGDITLTLPVTDYYVPLGGTAEIRIIAENDGGDIPGTLTRFENRTFIGDNGLPVSVRKKESGLHLMRDGKSNITIGTGSSDVTATSVLTIVFEYSDPEPRAITLDGPVIHFVAEVSSSPPASGPLESRKAGPIQTGSPGSSGRSGSGATEEPPPGNSGQTPIPKSLADETGSLEAYISAINEQYERNRTLLDQILARDPLYIDADRFLTGRGYSIGSKQVLPVSNETGTFLFEYRERTRFPVEMSGQISDAHVSQLRLSCPGSDIIPDIVQQNTSFLDYHTILSSEGMQLNRTSVAVVPGMKTITVHYTAQSDTGAAVTALLINGTLVSVVLDRPGGDDILPILVAGLITVLVLVSGGFVLYRRRLLPMDDTGPEAAEISAPEKSGTENGAQKILTKAMVAFRSGDARQAYEYAGRALRHHISARYGNGSEITAMEAIHILESCQIESDTVKPILEKCSLVAFAGYPADKSEFNQLIKQIEDFMVPDEITSSHSENSGYKD